jgi:hypothetical protein
MIKKLVLALVIVALIAADIIIYFYNWALAIALLLGVVLLWDIIHHVKEDHAIFKIWKKEIKQKDENKERPY